MTDPKTHAQIDAPERPAPPAIADAPFQSRVQPWMMACFGAEISADRLERGDRLLEEVLELLQSNGYPHERIASLSSYVWSRPKGEPAQEVGGVMVTLAAYCLAHGIDMHEAGEIELARVWTKVEKIRAKQAAKPTGSALPQAWPTQPAPDAVAEAAKVLIPLLLREHETWARSMGRNPIDYHSMWRQAANTLDDFAKGHQT